MSKTITLRLDDSVYQHLRLLAEQDNRPLSNFIETAALKFLETREFIDEFEMEEIRANSTLNRSLKRGHKDAASRSGRFV